MGKVKSLEETYTFRKLNGQSRVISNNTLAILKTSEFVKPTDVEEALLTIRKNFKYAAKPNVLKAIEDNEIIMAYASDANKLPSSLPFFLTEAGGKIVAVVMVDTYGVREKDSTNIKIDPKKLYVMLEGAYFARMYYTRNSSILNSTSVIGEGSKIYAAIIARIFNKKYALNRDKNKHSAVTYLASKFFMINLLGMTDGDTVRNYAYRNTATPNKMYIEQIDQLAEEQGDIYKDIVSFINFLGDPKTGLKFDGLTVGAFLEQYITMYYGEMLLALEYFPLFLYNINSVTNSGYINNQYVMEDIIEKSGPKLYNAVAMIQ